MFICRNVGVNTILLVWTGSRLMRPSALRPVCFKLLNCPPHPTRRHGVLTSYCMYPLHKPPDLFTPSIEQMGSLEVQVLIPGKSELVTLDVSHESHVFE